eukprot:503497_1
MGTCMCNDGRKFNSEPLPGLCPEDLEMKGTEQTFDVSHKRDHKRDFYDAESDLLVCAFIHFGSHQTYDIIIPRDIAWCISSHILRSLKIDKYTICTLESGIEYCFDELHLEGWSVLTADGYNNKTGEGGILCMKTKKLVVEPGACINMNGKGFNHKTVTILKGSTKKMAEKYDLSLGKSDNYGLGGGCIYLECNTLNCWNANILCCGVANMHLLTKQCGFGGTISIVVRDMVLSVGGTSKILACSLSAKPNHCNKDGRINIKVPNEYKDLFQSKFIGYHTGYGGGSETKANIRPDASIIAYD